jgi:predicted 3-demethylubiquinone-9 3-methyltransferase (glyoxalase superfamily)
MSITSTKIKPSLWFPGTAEAAATFYVSIFPSSVITNTARYTEAGKEQHKMEVGSAMIVDFKLHDQPFIAINGPPLWQFTQAISFTISCEDQEEVDHYWEKLGEGEYLSNNLLL